jgi:glyoxylase-like metal-dependent hydrolase (beta-lactamase superfamily II)
MEAVHPPARQRNPRHAAGQGRAEMGREHDHVDSWQTGCPAGRYVPLEAQTAELADWIAGSGKRLSTIYITHAHPDHFFGLKLLRDRFPEARPIAPAQVVDPRQAALAPAAVENWRRRFPGLIPSELASAERLYSGTFDFEDHQIVPIDIGHTDTDHTTCLHVPSIGLVIAGDAIYNGTHPDLVESNRQGLGDWLAAIDKIEALNPRAVVVGHGPMEPDNAPRHITGTAWSTKRYLNIELLKDQQMRGAITA